jgi:hypothetical protein
MLLTELGIKSLFIESQCLKTSSPICKTEEGKDSSFKESQPLNAPFPILITDKPALLLQGLKKIFL